MIISDIIWATPTSSGEILEKRVLRKHPSIRALGGDSLDTFIKIWNERLNDALQTSNREMEKKAQSLLKFLAENHSKDFTLLLWSEYKLSAVYNNERGTIFIIE